MDASFFSGNRQRLIERLGGGLVVLSAYTKLQRSNDMAHSFYQESNFWYLCGIDEPDWLLIVDGVQQRSWLVTPDISEIHRIFEGGMSASAAKLISGAESIISNDEGIKLIRTLATKHSMAYTIDAPLYSDHFNFALNPAITKNRLMLERTFARVQDCQKEIALLRAIKQPEEIKRLQRAIDVTMDAFNIVKSSMSKYKYEFEIEAEFTYQMRKNGAQGHAFDPVVASGKNGCVIHHYRNDGKIANREFVIMDIGAQVDGYAADVARTYVRRVATKRQIAVHEALQTAHQRIISLIAPYGDIAAYHHEVDNIMTDVIKGLDLYENEDSYRKYFPHAISHGLGIDPHDSLASPKHFSEGMVLTVEPGIYIPEESIGVRIEDDILVTPSGRRNMSARLSTGL